MKDIDKWFADQCSVEIEGFYGWFQMIDGEPVKDGQHWTIHDPRCREVIREKFLIETYTITNVDDSIGFGAESNDFKRGSGKTIAKAEIACCEAIYEAQK